MAQAITKNDDGLNVPNNPIVPFIEGDGIGSDIWAAAQKVFDAAVRRHMGESARLPGLKSLQVRRHSMKQANGSLTPQSRRQQVSRWDQGAAYDPRWWRHSKPQCCTPPDS